MSREKLVRWLRWNMMRQFLIFQTKAVNHDPRVVQKINDAVFLCLEITSAFWLTFAVTFSSNLSTRSQREKHFLLIHHEKMHPAPAGVRSKPWFMSCLYLEQIQGHGSLMPHSLMVSYGGKLLLLQQQGWDSMARRWFTIWFWDKSELPKNALNCYWSKTAT